MTVVSWHSEVRAAELRFSAVDGDRVDFSGDAGERSWSASERANLPPAVAVGRTYRQVRVSLRIRAELDPPDLDSDG